MAQVTIFTTPTCGFCHQAKRYLTQKGIPFVERDVAADPAAAREMVQRSGQQGVPVIVVDGQVVIGFDVARLEALLARSVGQRPRLGASIADAARVAEKRGLPPLTGVLVGRVHPGSAAEGAGLQAGDVLVEANGWPLGSLEAFQHLLSGLAEGQTVPLVVLRGSQRLRLQLVWGGR
ncbi:MAG: PDZ domain-containing protein [Chloroflexi bacterium]|nr:PDZ domain-containing protein [Chloroflexota bacterium]